MTSVAEGSDLSPAIMLIVRKDTGPITASTTACRDTP
jgi:hypothetical protein